MESLSDFIISDSNKREDYEILIKKKKESDFIAYCPQLNKLIKAKNFEEVYYMMDLTILEHIKSMYPDFEYEQISLSDKLGVNSINISTFNSNTILVPNFNSEIEELQIENLKAAYEVFQKPEDKSKYVQYDEKGNVVLVEDVQTSEIYGQLSLFDTSYDVNERMMLAKRARTDASLSEDEEEYEYEDENGVKIKVKRAKNIAGISTGETAQTVGDSTVEGGSIQDDNTQLEKKNKLDGTDETDEQLAQKKYVRKKLDVFKQYSQHDEILSK
jgi:hypothetical protein